MTALDRYDRLEASGLWRSAPGAQRREVVVSIGDATLKITDMSDRVLAHWSLAAIVRSNPGRTPALYHPDGNTGESLELGGDEEAMIDAIARIGRAIDRRKARPGRLRRGLGAAVVLALVLLSVLWLPSALTRYALEVVPQSQRAEIGDVLLERLERDAGAACATGESARILRDLAARLEVAEIRVLPGGATQSLHLPGGAVILHRELVEDHDDPAVPAGFVVAERVRAAQTDPLALVLQYGGIWSTLTLLTSGHLPGDVLDGYSEALLTRDPAPLLTEDLLAGFAEVDAPSTPYAYALDITGERTGPLIAGDPVGPGAAYTPLLTDADWLRLQVICGG